MSKAKRPAARTEYVHDRYDFPRFAPAAVKASLQASAGKPIKYRIAQVTSSGVWTSIWFEARDLVAINQAIRAGYLNGSARWAEDQDGLIIAGMDAQGNSVTATPVSNLESIRAWNLANVGRVAS